MAILINQERSLFRIQDVLESLRTTRSRPALIAAVDRLLPSLSQNTRADRNYTVFRDLLPTSAGPRLVLVLGGRTVGVGFQALMARGDLELVETDVAAGGRTTVVADAHDIPFADGAFDGVVIQGVLNQVVDPYRCVDEIHRVLQRDGLVYAETPFMQQVSGGRYDFQRFTHLGHRRLFRRFSEIESGVVTGPGMALAWSYHYFLLSFARSRAARRWLSAWARATGFWLKYFDRPLAERPGALDAASGYYFIGRKSSQILADRELIALYRGMG